MPKFLEKSSTKLIFSLLLAVGCGFLAVDCYGGPAGEVRVCIMQNAESLSLQIKGKYSVSLEPGKKILYEGDGLYATVTAYSAGIMVGEKSFHADKILILPQERDAVSINGRQFRGNILLVKDTSTALRAINYIDLEDYIRGVLYHEASHYWPDEVLKAQAIICRTYALYQIQESGLKDYDVTSDIYSQVYGGRTSERYRLDRAVTGTAGCTLTYNGKLFPAFYHACCGGHTEDASLVWGLDLAPLKGAACPFCKDSPHFNWHYVLGLREITDKIKQAGFNTGGRLSGIEALGRDASGRVGELKVAAPKKSLNIPAKDFRNIIGPNLLRSTNFTVSVRGGDAVFVGLGWGHGVGFCQWGGYFMAKDGRTYEEILKYYYPGVEIIDAVIAGRPKADEAISKP